MANTIFYTTWVYHKIVRDDDNGITHYEDHVETWNHGKTIDEMLHELSEEGWSISYSSYNHNNQVAGYRALLGGYEVDMTKGDIVKEYTASILMEMVGGYENDK